MPGKMGDLRNTGIQLRFPSFKVRITKILDIFTEIR
jgi:hypothetical protein